MAMVIVDDDDRRTRSPSHVAWSEGRRPLGAALHSPDEPSELSQWPGHDDSAINIVVVIITIIIIIIIIKTLYLSAHKMLSMRRR